MKKKITSFFTIFLLLFMIAGCSIEEEASSDQDTDEEVGDTSGESYTFMIFMNGTDLESEYLEDFGEVMGAASEDLKEMMEIGSTEDVNIVVETLGTNEWLLEDNDPSQNQRWLVQEGYLEHLEDLGNKNLGDSETLADFIVWSIENFPANRYVLDLWNHGGGPLGGFGIDEQNDGDSLSLLQITEALEMAYEETGEILEIIGFDACLMGSLEVAYAVSPYANYFVGSEELEPSHGWNYRAIFSELTADPTMSIIQESI